MSTTTTAIFDLSACPWQKCSFSRKDLNTIWKTLRSEHSEIRDLRGSELCPLQDKFPSLTLGQFGLIQLHDWNSHGQQQDKNEPTSVSRIPCDEWFEMLPENKSKPLPESLIAAASDSESTESDVEVVEGDQQKRRNRIRHQRRISKGLVESVDFPGLSLAQIRLFLHMFRKLSVFPIDRNLQADLSVQDFAIQYLFAHRLRRYNKLHKEIK